MTARDPITHLPPGDAAAAAVVAAEQLRVDTREVVATVRARKTVATDQVSVPVERRVERIDELERVPSSAGDSGRIERLEDGSISIPVLEEELVVTKRVVVRERLILRRQVATETQLVTADLRSERVSVEGHLDPEQPNQTAPPRSGT